MLSVNKYLRESKSFTDNDLFHTKVFNNNLNLTLFDK